MRLSGGEVSVNIKTYVDRDAMSRAAARHAAKSLQASLRTGSAARIIVATGASQLGFLEALTTAGDIDWPRVELFHLDEYIGLPIEHPASFRKYLHDRVISKTGIARYHFLDCEHDPLGVADRVGREILRAPIDLAFVGIGENGHLAFNDPPADFETDRPYILVTLDAACRRQQAGEGWFSSVEEVPPQAISMSVRQILKSREIICVVPDERKAEAVRNSIEGPVSPSVPASILQTHPNTTVYLDTASSSRLSPAARGVILPKDDD
jgi:glucosamine-6-phosphate deaminase